MFDDNGSTATHPAEVVRAIHQTYAQLEIVKVVGTYHYVPWFSHPQRNII